jgi:hypothetical protein
MLNLGRCRLDAAETVVFLVWGEGAGAELARDTVPLKTAPTDVGSPDLLSPEDATRIALERRRDLAAARYELRGAELMSNLKCTYPVLGLESVTL